MLGAKRYALVVGHDVTGHGVAMHDVAEQQVAAVVCEKTYLLPELLNCFKVFRIEAVVNSKLSRVAVLDRS